MTFKENLTKFGDYLYRCRRKLLIITSFLLTTAGWWQLDLLCSPAVWNPFQWVEFIGARIFLLPFNIPLSQTNSYCLFYAWIMIGYFLLLLAALLPKDKDERKA
jgi:hypothetical protein